MSSENPTKKFGDNEEQTPVESKETLGMSFDQFIEKIKSGTTDFKGIKITDRKITKEQLQQFSEAIFSCSDLDIETETVSPVYDFSLMNLSEIEFEYRVFDEGTPGLGLSFPSGTVAKEIIFDNSTSQYSGLETTDLEKASFANADLTGSNFGFCKNADFTNTNLNECGFYYIDDHLDGIDFSKAKSLLGARLVIGQDFNENFNQNIIEFIARNGIVSYPGIKEMQSIILALARLLIDKNFSVADFKDESKWGSFGRELEHEIITSRTMNMEALYTELKKARQEKDEQQEKYWVSFIKTFENEIKKCLEICLIGKREEGLKGLEKFRDENFKGGIPTKKLAL